VRERRVERAERGRAPGAAARPASVSVKETSKTYAALLRSMPPSCTPALTAVAQPRACPRAAHKLVCTRLQAHGLTSASRA
jgi:hypothetical protein